MTNKEAFSEAKNIIPGGVDSPVRAFKSVGGEPIFISKGKGSYIYDIEGNRYLDFVQSWGPLIFGHCDKDIEKAVIDTAKNGLSFGAPTLLENELANEVLELFPHLSKIRFVNSGTEAVMSAIRLARGYTKKDDIIKFSGCYHGHSDSLLVNAGSGLATFGNPSSPGVPNDFTKHTIVCEYNNIDSVKKAFEVSSNIACVVIEPIAGNMGLVPADIEFLRDLKNICKNNGALLIFDEVMSGFRASLRGSFEFNKIEADIVTFGKVIGGGMPVGAFASNDDIMSHLSPEGPVYQAGTLSGNPVAMSAGLASIKKLKKDKNIYNRLNSLALRLVNGLKNSAKEVGINLEVDTRGSMFGFFFIDKKPKNINDVVRCDFDKFALFHNQMLKKGFYFACSQYETGFICNSMDEKQIDKCIEVSKEVFREDLNGD